MAAAVRQGAKFIVGEVTGVEKRQAAGSTSEGASDLDAVQAVLLANGNSIPCDACVVCMGPWSSLAEEWFGTPVPITGIKSTSVVFKCEVKQIFANLCIS
jgi:glycine/D-amino acid oxidase-like deaminating enzyme